MSFASPFPDVIIPVGSVYDFLFGDLNDEDLDRVAMIDAISDTETCYREMIVRVNAFAGALASRGIDVGDVVGLLAPNSSSFAIALHGILRAGATATPINALFTTKDIAKQLVDSRAKMLVTARSLLPHAAEAAVAAGLSPVEVVVLDGHGEAATGHPNVADLLGSQYQAPKRNFDPARHLAVLPYSSGTTGEPKGVMLTHRNVVANLAQLQSFGLGTDDVVLAVLPFFHIYGMSLLNLALHDRVPLVILPSFDLANFLANIADHRCTVAFIAPPVAVALAKHPLVASYDLSSLRAIMSAAAPLDADLGHAVAERLGCRVLQSYGMSELSPASHITPLDGGQQTVGTMAPLSSVGWTVPNGVSKLIDAQTGAEIEPAAEGLSAPGELCFKGPNVMAGYLANEHATGQTIDADGWLHTGDMACVDAHGCVFIVDRIKELIKYKGYQVPPAELEAVLLSHPKIADAAAVGIRDSNGEEVPKAFIVKQTGAELTEDEVMQFVASRVAPYKKVRQVAFIDTIPRSTSGKILRKDLRTV